MYLSRLTMSQRHPVALRSIANPYEMHRTIWRAFPAETSGGPGRVLFRMEPLKVGKPVTVLVQSQFEPNWRVLQEEGIVELVLYKEFSPTFTAGQLLRFRLLANPSKKITDYEECEGAKKPKKARVGLFGEGKQLAWLERKAKMCGFELRKCQITARFDVDCRKPGHKDLVRHHAVLFDGILRVLDPEELSKAVETGIGPAKSFGFGLLSLAPVY